MNNTIHGKIKINRKNFYIHFFKLYIFRKEKSFIFPSGLQQLTELVCSTIEKLHDLSLNRCKTGWILSLVFMLF